MKRLLMSLVFIITALFIVDRLGGRIMWQVNQNTQSILGIKLKYLATEANEDLILLGTSRCNFHYVPSILKDSTGLSVYNGGINGSDNIYSHYFVLNQILTHHIPKIVCLELMPSDYICDDKSFETTTFFAPYIGRSVRADSIFIHSGSYHAYRLSHLYRYNAKAVADIAGLIYSSQQIIDNGYIPLEKPTDHPKIKEPHILDKTDTLKLQYLQKFITLCKDNNIKLVFTISPSYTIVSHEMYKPLKDVAYSNEIPFLDYHTMGLFADKPEYFKDNRHLWDKGARTFTAIFAQDLKLAVQIQ